MGKGRVASQFAEPVTGKVWLVGKAGRTPSMPDNYIIVSKMTTPKLTADMQRAAGVITVTGGILCHAAIVSREFGIPCIVSGDTASSLRNGNTVTMYPDGSFEVVDAAEEPFRCESCDYFVVGFHRCDGYYFEEGEPDGYYHEKEAVQNG